MAVLAGMASGAGSQQVVAQTMGVLRDAKGFEEIIDGLVDGVGEECPAESGAGIGVGPGLECSFDVSIKVYVDCRGGSWSGGSARWSGALSCTRRSQWWGGRSWEVDKRDLVGVEEAAACSVHDTGEISCRICRRGSMEVLIKEALHSISDVVHKGRPNFIAKEDAIDGGVALVKKVL